MPTDPSRAYNRQRCCAGLQILAKIGTHPPPASVDTWIRHWPTVGNTVGPYVNLPFYWSKKLILICYTGGLHNVKKNSRPIIYRLVFVILLYVLII